jgi:hypothetical protein
VRRSAALLPARHRSRRSSGLPSAQPLAWAPVVPRWLPGPCRSAPGGCLGLRPCLWLTTAPGGAAIRRRPGHSPGLPWCFGRQPGRMRRSAPLGAWVRGSLSGSPQLPEELWFAVDRPLASAPWGLGLRLRLWAPPPPEELWISIDSATRLGSRGTSVGNLGGCVAQHRVGPRLGLWLATAPGRAAACLRPRRSPWPPLRLGRQPGRLYQSAPDQVLRPADRPLTHHRSRRSCGRHRPGLVCGVASGSPPPPEGLRFAIDSAARLGSRGRSGLRRCLWLATAPGRASVRHRLGRSPRLPWCPVDNLAVVSFGTAQALRLQAGLWLATAPGGAAVRHRPGRSPRLLGVLCSAALPLTRHRPRRGCGSPSTRPLARLPWCFSRQPGRLCRSAP